MILKLFLLFFSYPELLNLNLFVQMGLAVWVAILILRKCGCAYVPPYVVSLFCLMPVTVVMSLQFSTMVYITLIAVAVYLKYEDKLENAQKLPEFFMILGIVTAYMDFLTYPLLAVGIVLVLDVLCNGQTVFLKQMQRMIFFTICWGMGYFGMWIAKWILVAVCTQYNIFKEAFMMIQYRMEYAIEEETITYKKVIKYNIFYIFANAAYVLPIIGAILYYCVRIVKRICSKEIAWRAMFAYFYVVLLPFIWYAFTANHSCQHYYFTNRTVVVAVFAGLVMLAQLAEEKICKI